MSKTNLLRGLVLAALAVPLSLGPGASPADDSGSWVRLSGLCAQADECESAPDYICSTADGDKLEEKCSKGCGGVQLE